MLKTIFTFLLIIFIDFHATAQVQLTWKDLTDVTFKSEYNEKYDTNFLVPTFGNYIKSYKGKPIKIKGYFLDISSGGDVFLVSQKPMASCFFCGAAGPETIIEVQFKEKPPFKTDQIVIVTGIFDLNADDVDHCNYILKNADGELVK
ncbi:hypothetical protein ABN763_04940 [Spongiivirga sp. MCCC 1A20706]|uniref:hypothetical protein n=1 Tax=Spongiivirga sp. MCCC 1A20706 TaxID=3160963 RepID=UPI003977635B